MVKSNEKASSSFVKKSNAFVKKKLKMGKFLHRENATNTNFKSKQIILPHQVKLSQEVDNKTRPKESINDLCQMLTHQNEKFCKSALSGFLILDKSCNSDNLFQASEESSKTTRNCFMNH